MDPDKKSAWLRQLDEECPHQVVLPRRQLADDSEILDFLLAYVGKFDMYVEDDYAAFVRYSSRIRSTPKSSAPASSRSSTALSWPGDLFVIAGLNIKSGGDGA